MSEQLEKARAILPATSCAKLLRQQQKNTLKSSSDAYAVNPNKELSQLSAMITPWSEYLMFG